MKEPLQRPDATAVYDTIVDILKAEPGAAYAHRQLTQPPLLEDLPNIVVQPYVRARIPGSEATAARVGAASDEGAEVRDNEIGLFTPGTGRAVREVNPATSIRARFGCIRVLIHQRTIIRGPSQEAFPRVAQVLLEMDVQKENEYRYHCIRPKRKRDIASSISGGRFRILQQHTQGSGKWRPPYPDAYSSSEYRLDSDSLLPALRGWSAASLACTDWVSTAPSASLRLSYLPTKMYYALGIRTNAEPLYGEKSVDAGDQVRLSVEVMRLYPWDDAFYLDIRLLEGDFRSYRFLRNTLQE